MKTADQKGTVWIRLVLCTVILATGFGGFVVLKKMKKPPVQTVAVERSILVEGLQVAYSNFPVRVSGFGEVRSRSVVPISALLVITSGSRPAVENLSLWMSLANSTLSLTFIDGSPMRLSLSLS